MLHFSEPDRLDTYLEPLKANYVHPEKVQVSPILVIAAYGCI